jgi:hypothetical protein
MYFKMKMIALQEKGLEQQSPYHIIKYFKSEEFRI